MGMLDFLNSQGVFNYHVLQSLLRIAHILATTTTVYRKRNPLVDV
jgi:hypothetical protein